LSNRYPRADCEEVITTSSTLLDRQRHGDAR
jgi:hypothetical protein